MFVYVLKEKFDDYIKQIIFKIEIYLLEDAPDGQSVRGGLSANSARNKVAYYFQTDAGAVPWQMQKIGTPEFIKRNKVSLLNFN
jgi:hypothetical protein